MVAKVIKHCSVAKLDEINFHLVAAKIAETNKMKRTNN